MTFSFENIRETLKFDIATGDVVTPRKLSFKYKTMLDGKIVKVWTYTTETILAEKIEAIFSKLETSSKMKDYYDIYLIFYKSWDKINKDTFIKACHNTFEKRGFDKKLLNNFNIIKDSKILRTRWGSYSRKYTYAENIDYDDILECIWEMIKILEPVTV